MGLFYYKINIDGKVLEKESLSHLGYLIDIYKTEDSNYIFLGVLLNSHGESEGLQLVELNPKHEEIRKTIIKSTKSFIPERLDRNNSGFQIFGNLSDDRSIPHCCFLDNNLNLLTCNSFHFEPAHYMFKSSFQLRDNYYDQSSNLFFGSGVTKVSNEDSNVIFSFNNDKIISYQILDKTSIWGKNRILVKEANEVILATDFKLNNDFDTKIKLTTFKIK
jgi:hypothetical protein